MSWLSGQVAPGPEDRELYVPDSRHEPRKTTQNHYAGRQVRNLPLPDSYLIKVASEVFVTLSASFSVFLLLAGFEFGCLVDV